MTRAPLAWPVPSVPSLCLRAVRLPVRAVRKILTGTAAARAPVAPIDGDERTSRLSTRLCACRVRPPVTTANGMPPSSNSSSSSSLTALHNGEHHLQPERKVSPAYIDTDAKSGQKSSHRSGRLVGMWRALGDRLCVQCSSLQRRLQYEVGFGWFRKYVDTTPRPSPNRPARSVGSCRVV